MKPIAIFLYGIAFFISLAAGSIEGTLVVLAQMGVAITVFLGITSLFLILFRGVGSVKKEHTEHREHRKWIL